MKSEVRTSLFLFFSDIWDGVLAIRVYYMVYGNLSTVYKSYIARTVLEEIKRYDESRAGTA